MSTLTVLNQSVIGLRGLFDQNNEAYVNDASPQFAVGDVSGVLSVTGATSANPIVITSAGHGLSNGDKIIITDVVGLNEANGIHTVADALTDTFELSGVDGSSGGTYVANTGKVYPIITNGGPIACSYVSGSTGNYNGILPGTAQLVVGNQYVVYIWDTGSYKYAYTIERTVTARKRI